MPSTKSICIFTVAVLIFVGNSYAKKDFKIYWNIPSFMCRNHKINITNELTGQFGILHNHNDDFRGNEIAILYDPGKFPAILQNSVSKKFVYRNNGVPQEGILSEHLEILEKHIDELIPDKNFSGLAIIDFESWRPIYRQNFGTLQPYKDLSIYIERQRHSHWSEKHLKKEASKRFEDAGKKFMKKTLLTGQNLRPNAKWGYYAFPYCFNERSKSPETCSENIQRENNGISWLIESSDLILPSVYLSEKIPSDKRIPMIKGRINESLRLMKRSNVTPKLYVYHRYLYTDTLKYISESDTFAVINTIKKSGADGVILWGSSNDLNSRKKCEDFLAYLTNTLGPVVHTLQQPQYSIKASSNISE